MVGACNYLALAPKGRDEAELPWTNGVGNYRGGSSRPGL